MSSSQVDRIVWTWGGGGEEAEKGKNITNEEQVIQKQDM